MPHELGRKMKASLLMYGACEGNRTPDPRLSKMSDEFGKPKV